MIAGMPFGSRLPTQQLLKAWLAAWAILVLASLWVGTERIGRPFPGFIVSDNLYIGATDLADWTGPKAGLVMLDRVVAVDGTPVPNANALLERVREAPAGTPFRYTLADGRTVVVPSMVFTAWEFMRSVFPFWLAAVAHLAFGGWVLLQRPHLAAAAGHWIYCQVFAAFLLGGVFGERWPLWNLVNLCASALMVAALAELVLVFPARLENARVERRLRIAAWAVGGAISLLVLIGLVYDPVFPTAFGLVLLGPILALAGALGVWTWQAFGSKLAAPLKGQARMVLIGLGVSLVPSAVFAIAALVKMPLPGFEFAFVGFCAFPAAIALAIVRYQAFDLNYLIRRATLYTLLTAALGLLYLAAATAAHLALGRLATPIGGASLEGFLAALAVAAAFRPWYVALRSGVDRWFRGDRPDPLGTVAAFTADAERLEADALARRLVVAVRQALDAEWVELRWNGLVATDGARDPVAVPAASLAIAPKEGPDGSLEVGPCRDGTPYEAHERALLEVLALQAAMAIDRALLFEARLQLGMREATALGRAEARELLLKQVVHDLSTELSNIAVSADLARQMPGETAPIESIQDSLGRIERFLAEKRYRLSSDRPSQTALGPALEAATATLSPQLALRRQRLETAVSAREAVVPLSDVELAQVIVNVVENASKYSPVGSRVRLAALRREQQVVIRIEDDGPGVPDALLDTLGDGRRGAPEVPGSGLGLQNCRALVTAAGGTLAWRNGDRGAVVELSLPVLA